MLYSCTQNTGKSIRRFYFQNVVFFIVLQIFDPEVCEIPSKLKFIGFFRQNAELPAACSNYINCLMASGS